MNFTILLTTFNSGEFVLNALNSIVHLKHSGEVQLIISDDSSTDETFDIVRSYIDKYNGEFKIKLIQTPKNLGLAGNVNFAIQYAEFDWIVRADADDLVNSDKLLIIEKIVKENNDLTSISFNSIITSNISADYHIQSIREEKEVNKILTIDKVLEGKLFSYEELKGAKVWNKKIFNVFGELPLEARYSDDLTLFIRSLFIGKHYLANKYSTDILCHGDNNLSGIKGRLNTYEKRLEWEFYISRYYLYLHDVVKFLINDLDISLLENHLKEDVRNRLIVKLDECLLWREWVDLSMIEKIKRVLKYKHKLMLYDYMKILPVKLFSFLMNLKDRVQNFIKRVDCFM